MITVPIDAKPLAQDKATLIIFHEQGFVDEFATYMDRKQIGFVTSEKPLKIAVEPGYHELYVKVGGLVIDRATMQEFAKNTTYYMKIWLDLGMWVSSIRIDPTYKIDSYQVRSHK